MSQRILRRMAANRRLGTATSAIWNVTQGNASRPAMDVTVARHRVLQVPVLVEAEQRTVTGASKMTVVCRALLLGMRLAHQAVHIEDDLAVRFPLPQTVDPLSGKVHQGFQVFGPGEDLRLKPAHLAGRCRVALLGTVGFQLQAAVEHDLCVAKPRHTRGIPPVRRLDLTKNLSTSLAEHFLHGLLDSPDLGLPKSSKASVHALLRISSCSSQLPIWEIRDKMAASPGGGQREGDGKWVSLGQWSS